ncbi:tetratricopeptide repeat protein [Vibrio casei]|uniref:tetratricopeptide repeat protein n=1 Tax=Vibrio casei TaxID=673372 RepID=UPI003F9A1665
MSTINNALSTLAEQQSPIDGKQGKLVRANVSPVKSSRFVWAIGGFTLSLGIGAWAVNSSPVPVQTSIVQSSTVGVAAQPSLVAAQSNTNKVINQSYATIYVDPKVVNEELTYDMQNTGKSVVVASPSSKKQLIQTNEVNVNPVPIQLVSTNNSQPKALSTQDKKASSASRAVMNESSMNVQQVELTRRQMADKSIDRASKALEINDFEAASTEYQDALRYVPTDEVTRRKLAALYYGNRQVRKSAELLESGIKLNKNSNDLRMSLATILIKEEQPEAALSALSYIPDNVSEKYLAMRAALSQQLKNNDWALQSYQMLTKRDPENARWWLGLGIQQERAAQSNEALESYNKALTMVGLSSQSQSFVRDRVALLKSLEQGVE